jgi:hypothetical protein
MTLTHLFTFEVFYKLNELDKLHKNDSMCIKTLNYINLNIYYLIDNLNCY